MFKREGEQGGLVPREVLLCDTVRTRGLLRKGHACLQSVFDHVTVDMSYQSLTARTHQMVRCSLMDGMFTYSPKALASTLPEHLLHIHRHAVVSTPPSTLTLPTAISEPPYPIALKTHGLPRPQIDWLSLSQSRPLLSICDRSSPQTPPDQLSVSE